MKLHEKIQDAGIRLVATILVGAVILFLLQIEGKQRNKIPPQTKIFWLDWPKIEGDQTNEIGEIYKWDYKFGFREDGVMVWCKTNLVITNLLKTNSVTTNIIINGVTIYY